jgi:hypothetical protein
MEREKIIQIPLLFRFRPVMGLSYFQGLHLLDLMFSCVCQKTQVHRVFLFLFCFFAVLEFEFRA